MASCLSALVVTGPTRLSADLPSPAARTCARAPSQCARAATTEGEEGGRTERQSRARRASAPCAVRSWLSATCCPRSSLLERTASRTSLRTLESALDFAAGEEREGTHEERPIDPSPARKRRNHKALTSETSWALSASIASEPGSSAAPS